MHKTKKLEYQYCRSGSRHSILHVELIDID